MRFLGAKYAENAFAAGPRWGSSPDPIAGFKGLTSKGRKGRGIGRRRGKGKRRGWKGKGAWRGEGKREERRERERNGRKGKGGGRRS